MKGELRFEDSSDELESDTLPLLCLVPKRKGSGKREALEKKKRSRVLLSDSESDEELLVKIRQKIGREKNGGRAINEAVPEKSKRKRKKSSRSKHLSSSEEDEISEEEVEEDEHEIKRSKMDVFEYNEDDIVDYKKMKKEIETKRSIFGLDGRKHLKVEKKNRGNDVSDKEMSEMEEDTVVRSAGKLKQQSKVSRRNLVKLEGERSDSVVENKKVDKPEKGFDRSEAEEKNNFCADSSIGRRTRSSFTSQQNLEKACSPKLTEKSKPPAELPAKKKENKTLHHLRRVEKETSLQVQSGNVVTYVKKKVKNGKGTSTTDCGLPSERQEKRTRKLEEKEEIRDQIREILNRAGWTIDYRPRISKDYSDAVYIDLVGSEYWSILKAYYGLEKHWKKENTDRYASGFTFIPMPTEILDRLTRRTKKKIEREKMMEKRNKKLKGTTEEMSDEKKDLKRSNGSSMNNEKLNVLIKHDRKSLKKRMKKKGFKRNRKHANKRPTPADSSDESDNNMHNVVSRPPNNAHLPKGRKSRTQRGYTLLARKPDKDANSANDHFVAYEGSRTVLSWLVNCETVSLGEKVKYMNKRRTRALLEGSITRDGINCGCCGDIVTISEFETHAGRKLRQPCQNIYVETGVPLFQCQIDAWNKQGESERSGFHCIDTTIDDPNDDACGICGDGGDLICCDGCPSTFHQSCLGMQVLPKGDWHCFNCCCKFCGIGGCSDGKGDDATIPEVFTCSLCEEKYHGSCIPQKNALPVVLDTSCASFCGQSCKELFEQLQKLLGVKHELEAGFSWTLIQRSDLESDSPLCGLPQKVECNSKLALALSVLDECFLPTVDERSGINLIHNVVYNFGSNFKRLDYRGFYTFVLEKGDEMICAASIRMHGTRFAEMPFIGTRHIYRRQGMCRRLLNAIESSLGSLNVEKLIIPAISELMNTWTRVFGFSHIEESYKSEIKFLNMLVFPGVDLLQKKLSSSNVTLTDGSVVKAPEPKKESHFLSEATENSETVSVEPCKLTSDVTSDIVDKAKMDLQAPGEVKSHPEEEIISHNSHSPHESISEPHSLLPALVENPIINCSIEGDPQASMEGTIDDVSKLNVDNDGSDLKAIKLNEATDISAVALVNYPNGLVDKICIAKNGLEASGSPVRDSSVASNPLDIPGEEKSHASKEEALCHNSHSPEVATETIENSCVESGSDDCLETSANGVQEVNLMTDGGKPDLLNECLDKPSLREEPELAKTCCAESSRRGAVNGIEDLNLTVDGAEPDLPSYTESSSRCAQEVFDEIPKTVKRQDTKLLHKVSIDLNESCEMDNEVDLNESYPRSLDDESQLCGL